MTERKHSHYFKDVTHLKDVDVYRVLELYEVTNPNLQHAIKKLLVAGGRGAGKNIEQDVNEAIDTLSRYLQMRAEDCNKGSDTTVTDITHPMMRVVRKATGCTMTTARQALEAGKGDIMYAVTLISSAGVK